MLLRNLDPPRLCNGTRLMLKKMPPTCAEAEILLGKYAGERVPDSRIPLTLSDNDMPIPFERLQFRSSCPSPWRSTSPRGKVSRWWGLIWMSRSLPMANCTLAAHGLASLKASTSCSQGERPRSSGMKCTNEAKYSRQLSKMCSYIFDPGNAGYPSYSSEILRYHADFPSHNWYTQLLAHHWLSLYLSLELFLLVGASPREGKELVKRIG